MSTKEEKVSYEEKSTPGANLIVKRGRKGGRRGCLLFEKQM